ncbi:MAG TPA: NAD(P)-dependent oxidoreductase [Rhodospirillales bacterium]|nr:NAD(P)-dependent oxidoreductase [Rhodospirillales bacterium]HIE19770.1 NAD(P)-dependent oxidoreductase [Rhodospirillales bacterium]HIM25484.1 NAD(P)-dependent oxidoreductase [Rhodospirillales bacterium]
MSAMRFGFAGLGQMGGPMAANIVAAGFDLSVFDKAGTAERAPDGAKPLESLDALAAVVDTLFLSLPDGPVTLAVARDLAALQDRAVSVVIDLSTIGLEAAKEAGQILADAGIQYIDAPVSGGQSGAIAGTITVMWGGPAEVLEIHRDVIMAIAKNLFHVGDQAGHGQTVKLLNNFLSGTAMAATSEAVAFGLSQGIEMKSLLDVVNVSTGRNTATSDKFPNRVLTGSYDAGFKTKLLTKDVGLFLDNAKAAGTPTAVAETVVDLWRRCDAALPDSDFTRIYEFLTEKNPDQ